MAGTDGSAGGTTSFGAHCSATGGAGGDTGPGTSTGYIRLGGLAGAGSGGDLNVTGGDGGNSGVNAGTRMVSGFGGSTCLGGGPRSASSGAGRAGACPGTGGSGASLLANTAAVNGGDGANGIVIVWEYLK